MMKTGFPLTGFVLCGVVAMAGLCGCNRGPDDMVSAPTGPGAAAALLPPVIQTQDPAPPAGVLTISTGLGSLDVWPYTGQDFSGEPSDPINLVFVGKVDPARIRAALLALDGNRTAYGFPPVPPFNGTWADAMGDVQTSYVEGEGWVGSVIQLELGSYESVRFHLRLFDTGRRTASGEGWTIANAHFDVRIPGTAEHQVISWELPEALVAADLIRSGLLAGPPSSAGIITTTPSFRDIPAVIYNGIPDALKVMCALPPGPTTSPVPIPNDGSATLLHVVGDVAVVPDTRTVSLNIGFDQLVPRPFCSRGPLDYVLLQGPLELSKTVRIDEAGRYSYRSSTAGHLTATPVDVRQSPPAPAGESFEAVILDEQHGFIEAGRSRVTFDQSRIAPQDGGAEKLLRSLKVASSGEKSFRSQTQCISP